MPSAPTMGRRSGLSTFVLASVVVTLVAIALAFAALGKTTGQTNVQPLPSGSTGAAVVSASWQPRGGKGLQILVYDDGKQIPLNPPLWRSNPISSWTSGPIPYHKQEIKITVSKLGATQRPTCAITVNGQLVHHAPSQPNSYTATCRLPAQP